MTPSIAISAVDFAAALKKTGVGETRPKIAVAVSGGGDSLALALLVQEWVKKHGGEMVALTVDHSLRAESGAEAQKVGEILAARGIAHEILTHAWDGDKPETHIQERARDARYKLLSEACRKRGFTFLAVAHNLEDQTETFWMRLAHGSGLDGLAGMAASRDADGIKIIRPVLGFSRAELRATCEANKVSWIEDPSNKNEKYLRVRLREFEEMLAGEGLTPARLAQTMQKLEDSRDALQVMVSTAFSTCAQVHPEGYATLNTGNWQKSPREVQRRVLTQLLTAISPQDYPLGFDAVESTRLELQDAIIPGGFAGKTLAGCEIFPAQGGYFVFVREAAIVEGPAPAADGTVWDKRFVLSGISAGVTIGALGSAKIDESKTPAKKALPFKIRRVLPAFFLNDNLCAVPHLGYYTADCPPEIKAGKIKFLAK
jgi:tRNA(Ile)-lysidine synthase